MAGVVTPTEFSAVLKVEGGVSLEVTIHEAISEVDHMSVAEFPGCTRLGVEVKEVIVPAWVQLYGVLGENDPLVQVKVCEVQGGTGELDAVTVLPLDTENP